LLLLALTALNIVSSTKNRVILIGIDGFNPSCIKNASNYENLQWMRDNGASTDRARTIIQTVSAPGWTSITCSLDPVDTGIINNEWLPPWSLKNVTEDITPASGTKHTFPCIFQAIKDQNPNLTTRFYYDWDWLGFLGNANNTEGRFVDDEMFCANDNAFEQALCDAKLVNKTLFNIEAGDHADFFFLYIGALDEVGHEKSWCSPLYEIYIGIIDDYIGMIKKKLESKGILNSTYIMLTADHGGKPGEYNHGEQNDSNILIPFYMVGPNIKKGYNIDGVHNMDAAPTILKMLGLPVTTRKFWRGRVIEDAFETEQQKLRVKFLENTN